MVVGGRELIDTLWNVNRTFFSKKIRVTVIELIDTLWNVNDDICSLSLFLLFELIDTLWNVNLTATVSKKCSLRINRYIMECKCLPPE